MKKENHSWRKGFNYFIPNASWTAFCKSIKGNFSILSQYEIDRTNLWSDYLLKGNPVDMITDKNIWCVRFDRPKQYSSILPHLITRKFWFILPVSNHREQCSECSVTFYFYSDMYLRHTPTPLDQTEIGSHEIFYMISSLHTWKPFFLTNE